MYRLVFLLLLLLSQFGCGYKTAAEKEQEKEADEAVIRRTKQFAQDSKLNAPIFGINQIGVILYEGPSEKYAAIPDNRNTLATDTIRYLQLDQSTKVVVQERKNGWALVQAVEPEWLIKTHNGWIPECYLTESTAVESVQTASILGSYETQQARLHEVFANPYRRWWNDGASWLASTNYLTVGSTNNLAFYLESPSERYVQTVKLKMNINDPSEGVEARRIYATTGEAFLKANHLPIPVGLKNALLKGKEFRKEYPAYSIANVYEPGNIDSWKMIINTR